MAASILYAVSNELIDELMTEEKTKFYLTALKTHDIGSYEHSIRVGLLAVDLGLENSFSAKNLEDLGLAGLLHDVGKRAVAREILVKKGKLDLYESGAIKTHPRFGFLILDDKEYDRVRRIVVAHHEHKKEAYPRNGERRKDDRIPERRNGDIFIHEASQIVAVADFYDALLGERTYKPEFDRTRAIAELNEAFTGDRKYIEQILKR